MPMSTTPGARPDLLDGADPYAGLSVLIHWHGLPGPPRCARRQVIVGPFYETVEGPDGVVSLNVPFGAYDIREVIERLPAHQRPDVFLVSIDSSKSSMPRNLAALDCPKALLVGDTHHLEAPIRYAFGCLLAEPYDLLVADYTRQHLHFFWHAHRARLAWIPGMWVRTYDLPFRESRAPAAVFVGRTEHHMYRRRVLGAIHDAGLPIDLVANVPEDQAARRYNEFQVTLNSSLNGDFNMRVFEALAHGGFLLTDRLTPEAGLAAFAEGEEMVLYDSPADAVAKVRHFLDRPQDALAIARRGFEAYQRAHRHEHKMRQLLSAVLGDGRFPSPEWGDPRAENLRAEDGQGLLARIVVYEHLQEMHRLQGGLAVAATAGVDARTLTDILDLPRLAAVRLADQADATAAALARMGYAARLGVSNGAKADVLLATAAELAQGAADPILRACGATHVVVTAATEPLIESAAARLAAAGYRSAGREPPVFERTS